VRPRSGHIDVRILMLCTDSALTLLVSGVHRGRSKSLRRGWNPRYKTQVRMGNPRLPHDSAEFACRLGSVVIQP
jgi:hypothetical protein